MNKFNLKTSLGLKKNFFEQKSKLTHQFNRDNFKSTENDQIVNDLKSMVSLNTKTKSFQMNYIFKQLLLLIFYVETTKCY